MLQICVGWQYLVTCPLPILPASINEHHLVYQNYSIGSYMKSSSQFSSRSWLLDAAMFSSLKRSSYAWSFWYFSCSLSFLTRASSFF